MTRHISCEPDLPLIIMNASLPERLSRASPTRSTRRDEPEQKPTTHNAKHVTNVERIMETRWVCATGANNSILLAHVLASVACWHGGEHELQTSNAETQRSAHGRQLRKCQRTVETTAANRGVPTKLGISHATAGDTHDLSYLHRADEMPTTRAASIARFQHNMSKACSAAR
jgi:hypothetical protein